MSDDKGTWWLLAALAALYLTLVTDWVGHCHFRILTQRVTFETWDLWDIWSAWFLDKKTKRLKRQKDKKAKRQKDKTTKNKDQKESLVLWRQGSFALLRCFVICHQIRHLKSMLFALFVQLSICKHDKWSFHKRHFQLSCLQAGTGYQKKLTWNQPCQSESGYSAEGPHCIEFLGPPSTIMIFTISLTRQLENCSKRIHNFQLSLVSPCPVSRHGTSVQNADTTVISVRTKPQHLYTLVLGLKVQLWHMWRRTGGGAA